ncbi:MAG: thioredoxin domain-containing protein [Patescibacteria group bacterium]
MDDEVKKMDDEPKSTMQMIDGIPARLAFFAGVLVSAALIFAVGFIVLLVLMYKGVELPTEKEKSANANSNANTNAAAAADPAAPTIPSGTVDPASLHNKRGTGDLTILEYSDPECPFCKRFHSTLQQVMKSYDGKVAWAYKQLPLTSLHSKAQKEAMGTECAADQGKFWEYLDLMMERTESNNSLPDEQIYTIASDVGADGAKFKDCVDNGATKDRVNADAAEAQKFGAQGTPYGLILDKDGKIVDVLEGALPYDSVAAVLDSHLK